MAATISWYNHALSKLVGLGVTPQASNFYVELLDSNASFDATDTTKDQVDNSGAYEVDGSGWTTGGENLSSVAISVYDTDKAAMDFADVSVTVTGSTLGPASAALIWLQESGGATESPIWYINFGGPVSKAVGEDFTITPNAIGICTFRVV